MLQALTAIASEHNDHTKNTIKRVKTFLDYAKYQADSIITFNAIAMVMAINYYVYYLFKNNAHSHAGGHHILSNDKENNPNNGAILNIPTIIRNVMSSAAEAELGALFLNAKKAVPMRKTLGKLFHT